MTVGDWLALASAIAAAFSAIAAFRSARTAFAVLEQSERAENRGLVREVMGAKDRIVSDAIAGRHTVAVLRITLQSLAAKQGAVGGSAYQEWMDKLDGIHKSFGTAEDEANAVDAEYSALRRASSDDLSQRLTTLAKTRSKLDVAQSVVSDLLQQVRISEQSPK